MTKLQEVMTTKGLTLAAIAEGTGLNLKTVWHAAQDRKTHRATRMSIARFLEIPEATLFPANAEK